MKYLIRDNIGTIYGYYETKGMAQSNLELYSAEQIENYGLEIIRG